MRINIMMGTNNDAFSENLGGEIARILRELAADIEVRNNIAPGLAIILRDINGNRVGVADAFKE